MPKPRYGPENPEITYVPHKYEEHLVDTGEVTLNYATTGPPDKPAIVLIPGQSESWWGYETAMGMLSDHFQAFAIDLRGQGRSSRTPGRYTFDNMGNDLVRFITFVVARPVVVSGLSSGGVLAAWLSAYAPPGMVRGAHYEDPPLFACEVTPAFGPSIRQGPVNVIFELWSTHLSDQWCVGDWEGFVSASREVLPPGVFQAGFGAATKPPQNLKEYDPEWARATVNGSISASCDHARMLSRVKCPVLFTHHGRQVDEKTGRLLGACSDQQVDQVERLVKSGGQPFTRLSFPQMGHSMHGQDPELYVRTLVDWEKTLPTEADTRKNGVFRPRSS
jgi:pimeloyl-ACP methyl ester carboxylesterase